MTPAEFLKAVRAQPTQHFYVVTPDGAGLDLLLPRILNALASERDVRVMDAPQITVAQARGIAREVRMAPIGGSSRTHFLIRRAHLLPSASASALLLAVEEAQRGRLVFVAGQLTLPANKVLASRCRIVRLPFLSRAAVLGNLQALHLDARTADEKDLWDGTLGGTLTNIQEGDDRPAILDALHRGLPGLPDLLSHAETPAFDRVLREHMTAQERDFLGDTPTRARRALIAYTMLARRT